MTSTRSGAGRALVAVYGVLALAASGRSILQIVEYFSRAPLAYLLSALAALIYVVATVGRLDEGTARIDLSVTSAEQTVLGKAQVVVATDR